MILVIDIGNSDITLGLWHQAKWAHVWRIPAVADRPELFYGIKIRDFFSEAGLNHFDVERIVLSSVVPDLTGKIINVTVPLFEKNPVVLGPEVYPKLPIKVLNPYEIGSDLVANALAAYMRFKTNCVVVDFGTALTFTTVSASGEILGVAITPGLKTAVRALAQNTAKLFDVPLHWPGTVMGKNTVHAIQAGVLMGYEGLVKSMLQKIRNELHDNHLQSIATGGLVSAIPSLAETFTAVEPHLTLEGLRLVAAGISKE
ncbi:MAG: type III pantothenate kinase [Cyclobacteriaceae bacterium]|nr:type III pantothenate kinase [Cyclobacteriaceae bacterium]MDW8331387.1 type III pantothenate kinase [Cyclobacteriaceae bacterium]